MPKHYHHTITRVGTKPIPTRMSEDNVFYQLPNGTEIQAYQVPDYPQYFKHSVIECNDDNCPGLKKKGTFIQRVI